MTKQRRLKQRVRNYMRATGATYAAARERVIAGISRSDEGVAATPKEKHNPMSLPSENVAGVRPFFIVTSLQASVEYYRDRLGFEPEVVVSDFFAVVSREKAAIHLKEISPEVGPLPNSHRHADARHDAFVSVVDPDALYDEIVRRGATVVKVLTTADGLRTFEVQDLDGYILAFGRPV